MRRVIKGYLSQSVISGKNALEEASHLVIRKTSKLTIPISPHWYTM